MEKIIEQEGMQQDRQNLKRFQKEILMTDNWNIYKDIKQRVGEFIRTNNLTQETVDSFNKFIEDCKEHYLNS